MTVFTLPYGNGSIEISIEPPYRADLLLPNQSEIKKNGLDIAKEAVDCPLEGVDPFSGITRSSRVVIAINDKSRPVPNDILLKPLLQRIHSFGVPCTNISLQIASGTHAPMQVSEFNKLISQSIIAKYQITAHNCDDDDNLVFVGKTSRSTPIWVNKVFFEADLRIVVGDIELHHFAGFSGGVKSAAIGLCGRKTINANHSLLLDPRSTIGNYLDNPLRQDIEEIGKLIKVDLALNAVVNEKRQIVSVWLGKPNDVFTAGIELINRMCQVQVDHKYDLVIASAGGYPKDINLYQAQKAMTHASLFCKNKGAILLIAECREGVGNQAYLDFMDGLQSPKAIKEKFIRSGFHVGPHKAFQIAKILEKTSVYLFSSLPDEIVCRLLLSPVHSLNDLIREKTCIHSTSASIAVVPYATACIPSKEIQ